MVSLKLFLFDVDGTLISTGGAGLRALSRCFEAMHGIADVARSINPAGKTDPAIFRELHALHLKRDMSTGDFEKISQAYLKCLEQEMSASNGFRPLAGVKDFLEHLKGREDIVIGLGTGNLEVGARLKLEPVRLNSYFSFGGFGSDSEERSEVLKAGHRKAERLTGKKFDPAHVYVIGDTPLDIAAARRAGFKAVAVASGRSTLEELQSFQPDYAFKDMTGAFTFLEDIDE